MSNGYPSIGLGPTTSIYTEVEVHEAWPAPEMPARKIEEPDKAAVRALIDLARAHGWTVRTTEAIGSWPSVGQAPSRQRRSLAVSMTRAQRVAVAVYVEGVAEGGAWSWDTLVSVDSGWIKCPDVSRFQDLVFGPLCKPSWPTDWTCPYFGPVHGPVKMRRTPKA